MKTPEKLLYSKSHEWTLKKDDTTVVIGITDFAQSQLGDVVYLELPAVGTQVEQGKEFGVIESVKAVSDLYAPISGEIVKVNESLTKTPDIINKDPYDQAWMIHIKISNPKDLENLLDSKKYETLTQQ